MATMTLTNVLGNNTTAFSTNSVTVSYDAAENHYDTSKTYTVTPKHRYYARASVSCPSAASGKSTGTNAIYSYMEGTNSVAGVHHSPSAGENSTEATGHCIFTIPDGVTKINPGIRWSASAGAGGGTHRATYLILIDITPLETAIGYEYTAGEFWNNVLGATLFATTKTITYTPAEATWPLADFNGTTYFQIGKLFDYDGAENHQISKVFDYDGSANYPIYSLEYYPLKEGAVFTGKHSNSACSMSQTETMLTVTSAANSSAWCASAYMSVNFSDWEKVKITYEFTGNYNRFYSFGFSTNTDISTSATLNTAMTTLYNTGKYFGIGNDGRNTSDTKEIDISGLSGNGYFKVAVCHSSEADKGVIKISNIEFL